MNEENKQTYEQPELVVFGPIARLTKQWSQANSDVPQGTPSSAFPANPPGS